MLHTSCLDSGNQTTRVARGGGAVGDYYMGTATHTFNKLKQLTPSLIPTLAHFKCSLFPPRLTDDPGRPPETGATHPVPTIYTYLCMLRAYPPPDTTRYVLDHFHFSSWNDAEEASLMLHTFGLDSGTQTTQVARGGGAVGAYYMGTATRTFIV